MKRSTWPHQNEHMPITTYNHDQMPLHAHFKNNYWKWEVAGAKGDRGTGTPGHFCWECDRMQLAQTALWWNPKQTQTQADPAAPPLTAFSGLRPGSWGSFHGHINVSHWSSQPGATWVSTKEQRGRCKRSLFIMYVTSRDLDCIIKWSHQSNGTGMVWVHSQEVTGRVTDDQNRKSLFFSFNIDLNFKNVHI